MSMPELIRVCVVLEKLAAGLSRKVARGVVAREQAFDFAAQFVVAGADHPKISRSVYFGSLQRAVKDLTNLRPSLGRQESLP